MSKGNKGPPFERLIAKELSRWWSGGTDDSLFWRTHSSGARATQRTKQGKRTAGQYGDICSTDPSSKPFTDLFTVSIKRGYPRYDLDTLFDRPGNKHGYREFIDAAIATAEEAKTPEWMLIVKRDHYDSIVTTHCELIEKCLPSVRLDFVSGGRVYGITFTKLQDFFKHVTPKQVLQLHRRLRRKTA